MLLLWVSLSSYHIINIITIAIVVVIIIIIINVIVITAKSSHNIITITFTIILVINFTIIINLRINEGIRAHLIVAGQGVGLTLRDAHLLLADPAQFVLLAALARAVPLRCLARLASDALAALHLGRWGRGGGGELGG